MQTGFDMGKEYHFEVIVKGAETAVTATNKLLSAFAQRAPDGCELVLGYLAPSKPAALSTQVGRSHYKNMAIQPVEFCQRNKLNYCEAAVVKCVCRHKNKNGAEDIKKASHFLNLLLELEYPEAAKPI